MKPKVKVFSKDKPVTKLQLWNCFRGQRGFVAVQVDTAHSIIGLNAPRYLKKKEYLEVITRRGEELYSLTEDGRKWLLEGFSRYLKNHPGDRAKAKNVPNTL